MTDPLCYELYLTILSLYEKYQILHSVINLLKVSFIIHCLFYLDTTYLDIGLICYLYWYMIKWQSYLQWIFLENHCSLFSLFQTVYIHEVLKMIQLLMFYCSWFSLLIQQSFSRYLMDFCCFSNHLVLCTK